MALNTRQVSFYMAQHNKGLTQEAAAATAGISVRSGRRIQQSGDRHWRTRQDPREDVWLSDSSSPVRRSRRQRSSSTCRINIQVSILIGTCFENKHNTLCPLHEVFGKNQTLQQCPFCVSVKAAPY